MSVVVDVAKGCDNLPTANKFWFSSYNPTVVKYGLNNDPVAKSLRNWPGVKNVPWDAVIWVLPDVSDGFNDKLNSLSLNVHLYCVSNISKDDENEQVTLDAVTKFSINWACPMCL